MSDVQDARYLKILLDRIETCKTYKPKFGQGVGTGLSLDEFTVLYSADPFYAWFGLDHPLMYAAHKAAGGITSVYRQIGIGVEHLFRQILSDTLGLSLAQAAWSYVVQTSSGASRTLSLDGRIQTGDIQDPVRREHFQTWLHNASALTQVSPEISHVLKGAVFEVRQGYKSKDSKRQNADISNAATAYANGYLPVVLLLSQQIDLDVLTRYQLQRWLVLRGFIGSSAIESTYAFMRLVVGYDLAAFFERNHPVLKSTIIDVLNTLLSSHD